ncbi:MAG: hypothetical protein QM704_27890 [Anaeromyxobacteraceae bacterium]
MPPLALALALLAGASPRPAPAFTLPATCETAEGTSVDCVLGEFASGEPVRLLGAPPGCRLTTGKRVTWRRPDAEGASEHAQGERQASLPGTELLGRTCDLPRRTIAVVHAREPLERIPLVPVPTFRRPKAPGETEWARRLVRDLAEDSGLGELELPAEASRVVELDGVRRSPMLLRFSVDDDRGDGFLRTNGPLLALAKDGPAAPFRACSEEPVAFRLAGRVYLRGASVCCECGWTMEQVFLVEQGKLREIWRSSVMSD